MDVETKFMRCPVSLGDLREAPFINDSNMHTLPPGSKLTEIISRTDHNQKAPVTPVSSLVAFRSGSPQTARLRNSPAAHAMAVSGARCCVHLRCQRIDLRPQSLAQ